MRSKIVRGKFDGELQIRIEELSSALRAFRVIKAYTDNNESIGDSRESALIDGLAHRILLQVEDGVRFHNDIAVETEIVDVIEKYFGQIVPGMTVDHFPKEDFDVLQLAGSSDSHQEIEELINVVKSQEDQIVERIGYARFRETLRDFLPELRRIDYDYEFGSVDYEIGRKKKHVKGAIFKGLGSIAQGTLLSVVDITLAAGLWSVTLPTETTTVGAVVSATTGVGMTLTGIGEFYEGLWKD